MKEFLNRFFVTHWPRKLVALSTAIIIWFLVNQTITVSRTIPDVAVRIVNLPADKTVVGLLPNGLLNKRITITVKGIRSVVENLYPNDLEIVIDATQKKESWIALIDKKSLVTLSGEVDFKKNITEVSANNLFINLSKLVTEEIPITIAKPIGEPPKGYQFLDVWPKYLMQKVSGPEEQVYSLKKTGLEVTFNLSRVSQDELDALQSKAKSDEFSFFIPKSWKTIVIPFKESFSELLNDPRSDILRIDFLKQELIPLDIELPITIFFPIKYSRTINPQTYSLQTNSIVQKKNGLKRLMIPLYVKDVSHLFLNVVRDNLLLIVTAAPKSVTEHLPWTLEFVDAKSLEDAFVVAALKEEKEFYDRETMPVLSEKSLRERFKEYSRNLVLFRVDGTPLDLQADLQANTITIDVNS